MNLAQLVRKLQGDIARLTKLVLDVRATGGGGGEANTASNQGAGGVGLYDAKVGVDLQFRNINAGSSKISVALDAGNKEVDVDVVMANMGHSHQNAATGGQLDHGLAMTAASLLDDDHAIYLLASGARALTGDWDAGAAAGRIISAGYFTAGTSAATAGRVRLPNLGPIRALNAAGLGNLDVFYADAGDRIIVGSAHTLICHSSGNIGIGGTTTDIERLSVGARIALLETTDPTNTANWGKIWVRSSDSKLYFMDDAGNVYELTAAGTVSSENFFPRWNIRPWAGVMAGDATKVAVGCSLTSVSPGADTNVLDADGHWHQDLSSAAAGNICYIRTNAYNSFRPAHNPSGYWHLKTYTDVAHVRLWVGFATGPPLRAANPNVNDVGFRFSTPDGDANWQFVSRNAGGTTVVDTGVAVAASTVYKFKLWTSDGGVTWFWDINGTSGSNILNVPLTTAGQCQILSWIPESAAADALLFSDMYWSWDLV